MPTLLYGPGCNFGGVVGAAHLPPGRVSYLPPLDEVFHQARFYDPQTEAPKAQFSGKRRRQENRGTKGARVSPPQPTRESGGAP